MVSIVQGIKENVSTFLDFSNLFRTYLCVKKNAERYIKDGPCSTNHAMILVFLRIYALFYKTTS